MKRLILSFIGLFWITAAFTQCDIHHKVLIGTPQLAIGSHLHMKGKIMMGIRHQNMQMEGMKSGTEVLVIDEVTNRYMMYSESMNMRMEMFMFMYGITDRLNLMLMGHWMNCEMEMTKAGGHSMFNKLSGIGDTRAYLVYGLFSDGSTQINLSTGLSLPTGSIENASSVAMNPHMRLGYAMQFGSGKPDALFSLIYKRSNHQNSIGGNIDITLRNGLNREDYRLGHQGSVNCWYSVLIADRIAFGGALSYLKVGQIKGADKEMNKMMSAGMDEMNSGANRLLTSCFLNAKISRRITLHGTYQVPLHDRVHGIQMALKRTLLAEVRFTL